MVKPSRRICEKFLTNSTRVLENGKKKYCMVIVIKDVKLKRFFLWGLE